MPPPAGSGTRGDDVGIPEVETVGIVDGNERGVCIGLEDADAPVDLHFAVSPTAGVGEPVNDGVGLRVDGGVADVLGPDGAGGK